VAPCTQSATTASPPSLLSSYLISTDQPSSLALLPLHRPLFPFLFSSSTLPIRLPITTMKHPRHHGYPHEVHLGATRPHDGTPPPSQILSATPRSSLVQLEEKRTMDFPRRHGCNLFAASFSLSPWFALPPWLSKHIQQVPMTSQKRRRNYGLSKGVPRRSLLALWPEAPSPAQVVAELYIFAGLWAVIHPTIPTTLILLEQHAEFTVWIIIYNI
jgi:hypothetical protein